MMRKDQNSGDDGGHRVPRRLVDLLRRRVGDVGAISLQEQRIAEIAPAVATSSARAAGRCWIGAHALERRVGDKAGVDARPVGLDELVDARDCAWSKRASRSGPARPEPRSRNASCAPPGRECRTSVKAAGAGSVSHIASIAAIFIFWFSVGRVAALVAEHDDRQRRGEAEAGGDRHRALGELECGARAAGKRR